MNCTPLFSFIPAFRGNGNKKSHSYGQSKLLRVPVKEKMRKSEKRFQSHQVGHMSTPGNKLQKCHTKSAAKTRMCHRRLTRDFLPLLSQTQEHRSHLRQGGKELRRLLRDPDFADTSEYIHRAGVPALVVIVFGAYDGVVSVGRERIAEMVIVHAVRGRQLGLLVEA